MVKRPMRFTPTCVGTLTHSDSRPSAVPVHPHVRGDASASSAWTPTSRRFTPTCVGTLGISADPSWPAAVHPHVRGDAVLVDGPQALRQRFTPTCVGTLGAWISNHPSMSVHPHVRGDACDLANTSASPAGSPPRAWGRFFWLPLSAIQARFTPTCVGTLPDRSGTGSRCSVHPHVRGDASLPDSMYAVLGGSPPRAWGRFGPRGSSFCCATVHPHVRGDAHGLVHAHSPAPGSPPRAWGRCGWFNATQSARRFTPTCVGTLLNKPEFTAP